MLMTILGLLLYAYTLVSVIGMELFSGTISRKCYLPTEAESLGLLLSDCPPMLECDDIMQCYEAAEAHWTMDRDRYVHRYGFDNLWQSFNTAFGVTILDDWSGMSIALSEAESSTRILAFPLFTLMVLIISLLIVNLFLASVTVSFLGVRQEMRAEEVGQTKKPTALEALELANAAVSNDGSQVAYSFPMNEKITPVAQKLVATPRFESAIAISVLLNTLLMMMNHYRMEQWVMITTVVFELIFTAVYTFEALAKIFATGFRPYLSSKINVLDFLIVVASFGGYAVLLQEVENQPE